MTMSLKVGWILEGNETAPGARIQGFNMHRILKHIGIESVILHAPSPYSLTLGNQDAIWRQIAEEGLHVVVFQKVYLGEAEALALRCRDRGIRTVYLASDWCGINMMNACDAGIAVSVFLKDAFGRRLAKKITVIPDALETPRHLRKTDYDRRGDRLKAVYVGSRMPEPDVLGLLMCLRDRMELTVISSGYNPVSDRTDTGQFRRPRSSMLKALLSRSARNAATVLTHKIRKGISQTLCRLISGNMSLPEFRFVEWRLDTVYGEIIRHDVAVIPCRLDSTYSLAKSNNRLTMFMALGMPVIASPIPSYTEIIRNGENGFLASSSREWTQAFEALRTVETAKRIGDRARRDVADALAADVIAQRYLAVFRGDSAM